MNRKRHALALACFFSVGLSTAVWAGESAGPQDDLERIGIMLEYNQRMVTLAETYLKDRERIPEAYWSVTDKAFLDKCKMEKPSTSADMRSLKQASHADPNLATHQTVEVIDTPDPLSTLRGKARRTR